MRNLPGLRVAALSLALLSGCESGPAIRVDRDPGADMAAYRTFGFFDQVATDRAQYSTIVTSRLKQATRAQLERNGLAYSEQDPDLRVNFYLKIVEKQEVRSTPSMTMGAGYYGYRGGMYGTWGSYPYDVETVDYKSGTLSIDLVDARKNALVWQGLAEGRVKSESVKNPGPAIDRVVADIFSNFPNPPVK
jgi:hypothetical protein